MAKKPKFLGWWLLAMLLAAVFLIALAEIIAPGSVVPPPWQWVP